ncbi:MAG: bifunctional (p)ppGpp synthetase/guanosine-3',5'-bis(diphosphate) 3'-pyrophosphohydrolase, partial [Syntrophobacteraceae bacterium]
VLGYYPGANTSLIEKAYVFAARVHSGRPGVAGRPYIDHPLAVAGILASMRLDEESIIAGLLSGCLEGQLLTVQALEEQFGEGVSRISQGVAKLSQVEYNGAREGQAEYMRKVILAMSQDIRVVLVKLAERLDMVRTLLPGNAPSLRNLTQETLDIYAPLAARVGIDWMRQELENLAFKLQKPQQYEEIVQGLAKTEEDRQRYIEEVKKTLSLHLEEYGLKGRISGRPKHVYSIHAKMARQSLDLNRIYDLIAFRVILDSVKECYEALGVIHAVWEPVSGRFKDYISKPKSNMYQSLHTTVVGPYGERMEVQIRTEEMDRVANEGIAAHWLYKEGKPLANLDEEETRRFSWLRELLEWNKDWRDPKAFFETVKMDFYPDEVYVFTPQGDVKALPRGATPVDFAYEVHTEVGHRCVGARVNGKLVPLRQELQNGDTIEIMTAANHRPSKDWLKFVKTTKAINRIRHWVKAEERERAIATGKEILEREFRKKSLNFNNYVNSPELLEVAKSFSLRDVDTLLATVGFRKISPVHVIGRLPSMAEEEEPEREEIIPVEKPRSVSEGGGIRVSGTDEVMFRMARCCNPVRGEKIVGYITRGRGLTIHRVTCRNIRKGDENRKIEVEWDSGEGKSSAVDIWVVHSGDKDIPAVISKLLGQMDVPVIDFPINARTGGASRCRLRIEVRDNRHLQRVLAALRAEKGVMQVQRVTE